MTAGRSSRFRRLERTNKDVLSEEKKITEPSRSLDRSLKEDES
jgi:hypothetical protein